MASHSNIPAWLVGKFVRTIIEVQRLIECRDKERLVSPSPAIFPAATWRAFTYAAS
jgi:hypothetical protein